MFKREFFHKFSGEGFVVVHMSPLCCWLCCWFCVWLSSCWSCLRFFKKYSRQSKAQKLTLRWISCGPKKRVKWLKLYRSSFRLHVAQKILYFLISCSILLSINRATCTPPFSRSILTLINSSYSRYSIKSLNLFFTHSPCTVHTLLHTLSIKGQILPLMPLPWAFFITEFHHQFFPLFCFFDFVLWLGMEKEGSGFGTLHPPTFHTS